VNTPKARNFLWMFPIILFFAFAVFGIGVWVVQRTNGGQYSLLVAGCVAVFLVLGMWCQALSSHADHQNAQAYLKELIDPVNERLQEINVVMNQVSEQQLISERAKGIAFRDNERDALRRAIREEISKKDYEAALVLAHDIERAFGYKQEADRFREEINILRSEEVRKHVAEAMVSIDRECRGEQWNQALREVEKLNTLFPNDPQVMHLPAEIEARRQAQKQSLLDAWNEAVNRHDVDGSIEILRQLDAYLTPAEAESMQETARRVFKDKLQLLGQQFTLAMKDHNWAEAVRIGEMVMAEFPNARMAQEVREKIDQLRQRAISPELAAGA
jgi:hypothetical protein